MSGQEPTWGVILDPKKVVPIYHRVGRYEPLEISAQAGILRTRCGRQVSWGSLTPWLQIIHLKRFARACRSCKSS